MSDLATAALSNERLVYELAAAGNGMLFAQTMEQRRELMNRIDELKAEQDRRRAQ